jgi:glyceraldehyde 3-phosphate dehydrogenase
MPNSKKTDLRRARSGMVNLCPTSTGSATAISEIFPELRGKLNGLAVRVPLLNASLTDCVFSVKRPVTVEEVNTALKAASESGPLKGILGYETQVLLGRRVEMGMGPIKLSIRLSRDFTHIPTC